VQGLVKYRGLLIAITLFLLVIASVTLVNFFIARSLDQDAIGVNLSGRQRMLSQRTAKTIFQLQQAAVSGNPAEEIQKELSGAVALFENTLNAFRSGGTVTGGAGTQVNLQRAAVGQDKITAASEIWEQYKAQLLPVVGLDGSIKIGFSNAQLEQLATFAAQNNVKILTLMNELTTALEKQTTARAANLRLIQIAALSIALLLFAYIVFFALRNLRRADAAVTAAKAETDNILNTVSDGLFLIDRELTIGTQVSKSLEQIFGVKELSGRNLLDVLKDLVPVKTMETAKSFLDLLFGERVKEALMGDVNPLKQVEISTVNEGRAETKFLSFQFRRVLTDEKLSHLLVSAADITSEIELKQELEQTRKRNEAQISLLAKMMHVGAAELSVFMDKTQRGLDEMNVVLAADGMTQAESIEKISQLFRIAHTIKGDAAAMDFDPIESWAHRFEDQVQVLRKQTTISGNDLLPLTVAMREMYTQISGIRELALKMGQVRSTLEPKVDKDSRPQATVWAKAQLLADKVAERSGKKIELTVKKAVGLQVPARQFETVSDALVQLVRNAIVHGIETPEQRASVGKPSSGTISISLSFGAPGLFEISVEDDGAGLDIEAIRREAQRLSFLSAETAASATPQQLVKLLFSSGFSTAREVTEDAGRGVGLDVIEQSVRRLGGRVSVGSRTGLGARFTLVLPEEKIAEALSA
jgi:two-component system, chemotaxis family, sensor kinase CheA